MLDDCVFLFVKCWGMESEVINAFPQSNQHPLFKTLIHLGHVLDGANEINHMR
jgi:hypothetical protein